MDKVKNNLYAQAHGKTCLRCLQKFTRLPLNVPPMSHFFEFCRFFSNIDLLFSIKKDRFSEYYVAGPVPGAFCCIFKRVKNLCQKGFPFWD